MSGFAEFHDELRAVAARLLADAAPTANHGSPGPAIAWPVLADAGWLGLEVPEEHGGAGATFAETAVVLRELGRAAAVSGVFGTVVLGVGALASAVPGELRDDLLRRTAKGEARLAVAIAESDARPARWAAPFRLTATPSGDVVHGTAECVVDGPDADVLLLLAVGDDGLPVLVAAGREATGLSVEPVTVVDGSRRVARVSAAGLPAGDSLLDFAGDAGAAAQRLFDRAAVALACDSLGVAEAMLDATVAYACQRHQFDRPIGSFQAVKHACADMLSTVVLARELVDRAVGALSADEAGERAATVSAMASSYLGTAGVDVAGKAMQLHGGIGYTWESGVHVYLKRAAFNRALFGSPPDHRARLAERYRIAGPA